MTAAKILELIENVDPEDTDKLDEIEFRDLFGKVVNAFIRYYGQDLSEIQINTILEY